MKPNLYRVKFISRFEFQTRAKMLPIVLKWCKVALTKAQSRRCLQVDWVILSEVSSLERAGKKARLAEDMELRGRTNHKSRAWR